MRRLRRAYCSVAWRVDSDNVPSGAPPVKRQETWLRFFRALALQGVTPAQGDSAVCVEVWQRHLRQRGSGPAWLHGGATLDMFSSPGAPHPAEVFAEFDAFVRRRGGNDVWQPVAVSQLLRACVLRVRRLIRTGNGLCLPGRAVHEEMQRTQQLFRAIRGGGLPLTLHAWTQFILLHSTLRQVGNVMRYVREMVKDAVRPDQHVCAMALSACRATTTSDAQYRSRMREAVATLWAQFPELRVTPDREMHVALVRVLASVGDRSAAEAAHKTMIEGGHRPSATTYAALLAAAQSHDHIEGTLRSMAADCVQVDAHVQVVLMHAFRRAAALSGSVAEVEAVPSKLAALLESVTAAGLRPTESMHVCLLAAHCDAGDVAGAVKCFHSATAADGVGVTATSARLLLSCCERAARKRGDDAVRAAEWLWAYCRRRGDLHNEFTHAHMMRMYLKVGDAAAALRVFDELKTSGLRVTYDHLHAAHRAYLQSGHTAKAADVARIPEFRNAESRRHAGRKTHRVFQGVLPAPETEQSAPTSVWGEEPTKAEEMPVALDGLDALYAPLPLRDGTSELGFTAPRALGYRGSQLCHSVDRIDAPQRAAYASSRRGGSKEKSHSIDDILERRRGTLLD